MFRQTNGYGRAWKWMPARIGRVLTLLAILTALVPSSIHADTQVGGPIISDTTWVLANSPYIVVESIDVWEGVTLIIEAGVVVRFEHDKVLQVNGTLIAQGTPGKNITFTSNQPGPQPGDWGNIEFTATATPTTMDLDGNYISGSILKHCTVEYAGASTDSAVDARSILIDHCVVQNNQARGISNLATEGAPGWISNSTVSGNDSGDSEGSGIYAEFCTIENNTITGNVQTGRHSHTGGGIYAQNCTVVNNTIADNSIFVAPYSATGGGIFALDSIVISNTVSNNTSAGGGGISASNSVVSNNLVSGNDGGGIGIQSSVASYNTVIGNKGSGWGIGISAAGSSTVVNNVVNNNIGDEDDSNGGGIRVSFSTASYNIVSNNRVALRGGGVYAYQSTVDNNIIVGNSVSDDSGRGGGLYADNSTIISNTILANQVQRETGSGSGAYAYWSDIFYNIVMANMGSVESTVGGLELEGKSEVHYNMFFGNGPYDVTISYALDISGTNNYWGTTDAVNILSQVYDWYDDPSRGKFVYIPYLQDPDPDAPVPPPLNLNAEWLEGAVTLDWDPIPSTTTGYGYKVYYDTDESGPPYDGTGLDQGNSPIDIGNATEYTLTGLAEDTAYYIALTAYDTLGREGWYSCEANNLAVLPRIIYLPLVTR